MVSIFSLSIILSHPTNIYLLVTSLQKRLSTIYLTIELHYLLISLKRSSRCRTHLSASTHPLEPKCFSFYASHPSN